MAEFHETAGVVVLVACGALVVLSVLAALGTGWVPWMDWAWKSVVAVIGAQALVGGVVYLIGAPPSEPLHYLYAAVALGVLPFANSFSADADPKPRAWVFALAAIVALGLSFRLFGTG